MNTLTGGNIVYSVNILLGIGLIGVAWVIAKILMLDYEEDKTSTDPHHTSSSDE